MRGVIISFALEKERERVLFWREKVGKDMGGVMESWSAGVVMALDQRPITPRLHHSAVLLVRIHGVTARSSSTATEVLHHLVESVAEFDHFRLKAAVAIA